MSESLMNGELKNFEERQKFCLNLGFVGFVQGYGPGFVCSCELCQEEEINNDDETYKKLQNLKEETEKIKDVGPFEFKFDVFEQVIACRKEMYNLAKKKKAPKIFILSILDEAFRDGYVGKIKKEAPKM